MGEGYPDRFYGETPETMATVMPGLLDRLSADLEPSVGVADRRRRHGRRDPRNGAAKCALDIALHDLVGKVLGLPSIDSSASPSTSCRRPTSRSASTSPRSSPSAPRARPTSRRSRSSAVGRRTWPRSRPCARSTPARSGSTPTPAGRARRRRRLLPELVDLGVELIEQPFPARAYRDLGWLQERSDAAHRRRRERGHGGGPRRAGRVVAGVNVKLAKVGGVGPARAMLGARASCGFRTFLGCMEETSVGIAASAVVASLADWVDLDGNLLLAEDPFTGLELGPDKRWQLPTARSRTGAPGRRLTRFAARSARAFDERPFDVDNFVDEVVDKPPSGRPPGLRWPTTRRRPQGPGMRPVESDTGPAREGPHRPPDQVRFAMHAERARDPVRDRPRPAGKGGLAIDGSTHRRLGRQARRSGRGRRSSASATTAVGWAGRSCMTRCAPSPARGLFRG